MQRVLTQMDSVWLSKQAVHAGEKTDLAFTTTVHWRDSPTEPERAILPVDVEGLWELTDGADLFVDAKYGQWGLRLLGASSASTRFETEFRQRPKQFLATDLVLGEFLGDSDLLVIRNDPSAADFGAVVVAHALDPRSQWTLAAPNLLDFLVEYAARQGEKFWE
jgi:hypothetical protein